jgi:hypothetical protein
MTLREELIVQITKEVVSLGKGIDLSPAVSEQAAKAIMNLVNSVEKEAAKKKDK